MPSNPIELAIRLFTVPKILPELAHSEWRYSVLEAANLCPRFSPDVVLPVSLSRRLGADNTMLYWVTQYPWAFNGQSLTPYAPSPLSGMISTGRCHTKGMPLVGSSKARPDADAAMMTYPQKISAFKLPDFSGVILLNVSHSSPAASSHEVRNTYNLANMMAAFVSWLSFNMAHYGVIFSKSQPCYVVTPTKENKENMFALLGIQDFGQTADEFEAHDTADVRLDDALQEVDA